MLLVLCLPGLYLLVHLQEGLSHLEQEDLYLWVQEDLSPLVQVVVASHGLQDLLDH